MGRIDQMGRRIDDLEQSITMLVDQAGIDVNDMELNETATNVGRLSVDNGNLPLSIPDPSIGMDGVSREWLL